MPNKVFVISGTHFGHQGICNVFGENGVKLRPWKTSEEMDEELVRRWNSVVGPHDKVYHLGDVAIPRHALEILGRLNGDKVLIRGNHDLFKLKDYLPYFRDIRGAFVHRGVIFTHVPVHPSSRKRFLANIHGHTHSSVVGGETPDPFYVNVCVEQIDYTPIELDVLMRKIVDAERIVKMNKWQ